MPFFVFENHYYVPKNQNILIFRNIIVSRQDKKIGYPHIETALGYEFR